MKVTRDDIVNVLIMTLLSSTPVAFMIFDFSFPNLSTPSLSSNLLAVLVISMLVGLPSGYLTKRTDLAFVTVILYTIAGYIVSLAFYSAPYIGSLEIVSTQIYYASYIRRTIVLLFIFILGGFVGTIIGQYMRDSIRREETSLTFKEVGE